MLSINGVLNGQLLKIDHLITNRIKDKLAPTISFATRKTSAAEYKSLKNNSLFILVKILRGVFNGIYYL